MIIKSKFIWVLMIAFVMGGNFACKDQLEVGNPNSPTLSANVTSVSGLSSLAQGVVYRDGFYDGDDWLGNSYFSLPYGYQELLGDMVGAITALNQNINRIGQANYFTLPDGTKVETAISNVTEMRDNNTRARTGSGYNATYYQWLNMYALNNGCNQVLTLIPTITSDASTKATFEAWCYWWKGYAYASIGSMYYSGLIIDEFGATSSNYVTQDAVIERSNYYFKLAATTLDGVSDQSTYSNILTSLIPAFTQTGNGGVPSVAVWKRNVNTMLARNILVNHLAPFVNGNPSATITGATIPKMTAANWQEVLKLATNGIQQGDVVFTGRSLSTNGFFTAGGGTAASLSVGPSPTFHISERFVQNFKAGDARLGNFGTASFGHTFFGTRHTNTNGLVGKGIYDYGSREIGEYELFIAGSYEENALMLAEANIRLGSIATGLGYVDAVRSHMGAGIAPVAVTVTTEAAAMKELFLESRVALAFRGLSFYNYRRWGITYDISKGGGGYGNTFYLNEKVHTNVTVNYNFMDYWDVPADEAELNPTTGAAIKNPNF
ncbi:RagB/SusD family nutrient uptake outer membrane protein [Dyadobacter psychrotolerans]|uniref:RagB/SusD family nutrient uptake outer membrane protein n=1 Tax=Dyadobacter psychrotolerans TaxID=2541721 RepID=A0A4R5DDT8_9BACT|nr:RagB/SusD family nutrient uptake outer membrane protein [Dyadobacter psychrotolerans]TDE11996.1 RagB/SusD family nutrient uptake outer membrane protein [Dyadobacter psychrotolerans]